jgi:hypothetical protein
MKFIPIAFACVSLVQVSQARSFDEKPAKDHKVVVEEVLQTTSYTYLHVKENDTLKWLAMPTINAKPGETYYYVGAMPMKDFESKELHRKFDEVLFLGGVTTEPISANGGKKPGEAYTRKANPEIKQAIKIEKPADCISIGTLLSQKETLAGKTVKIKAQVTKYSPAIMDKNWIHIQDGTENNGKFDFVVTSTGTAKVGDVVVLEGKITLNKDFGYGYKFEVMMEEAVIK